MITTERTSYLRDGYHLQPEPVLGAATLARAQAGLEAVRLGAYDTGEEPDGRLWNPGDDPLALCKIEQPQLGSHGLREALAAPGLGAVVGEVAGARRVQVWWVQLLYKPSTPPGSDARTHVGWHQDLSYWSAWEPGSQLLTAWLALSDVTAEAGPMVFVPGSHRWGLLPGGDFFGQDQEALRQSIAIPDGEEWREVPAILRPGGVSLHHMLLFHGSRPNHSGAPRCSLAIHLRTEDSAPTDGAWVAKYLDRPEICPVIYEA